MKKFIQICSLLSMLVVFTVISASAQSGFGTDVEIPFSFNVGDRSYDAGNYIVKLGRLSSGSATLSIQDTKTDDIQTVLLHVSSDGSGRDMNLVFDTIDGKKYLSKVQTTDKTFALTKVKSEKNGVKARNAEKPAAAASIGGTANL